jgi:hypothetical protein
MALRVANGDVITHDHEPNFVALVRGHSGVLLLRQSKIEDVSGIVSLDKDRDNGNEHDGRRHTL